MKKLITFLLLVLISYTYPQGNFSYKNPKLSVEKRVEDLLSRMTLQEKIDLLGGTGFATMPNKRLGIPELRMSDGPLGVRWDKANVPASSLDAAATWEKSTAFAGGIGAAATWDTALVGQLGSAIGRELKAHGGDVILGPCVNIARVPMGGRNFESFGEDPFLTSRMAVNYINGVQKEKVAATVKHFAVNNEEPNRGYANFKVSERALNEIYLPAFKAAITEAHSIAIMSAYNKLNGPYCSESDYLLKRKLKEDWKFDGLVMSDWGAVHSSIPTANGGLDLEMPNGEFLNNKTLDDAVKVGTVSEQAINDKVKRTLSVMFRLGLFDHTRTEDSKLINSKENQKVNSKLAHEGIVLLKNNNGVLPLNKDKIISLAVIGPNAAFARTGGGGSSEVIPIYSVTPLSALQNKLGKNVKINYAQGVIISGDALPVDEKFLLQPDGTGKGLLGEYFTNQNLEGTPAFTRIDDKVNFDWDAKSPKEGFQQDHYSVRWTGYLQFPKSGSYEFDFMSDDGVRMYIEDKLVINNWSNHAPVIDAYTAKFEAGKKYKIKIDYYQNIGGGKARLLWKSTSDELLQQAVEAAKNSDAALVFVGTNDQLETEGLDRKDIKLSDNQDDLINEVAKVNKNVIVVLTTGAPVLMNSWNDKVNGIIETWFAGSEIGNAVTDVILGKFNPSGKLPLSFPKRWEDCSAYDSYKPQDTVGEYTDDIFVGYRYFDAKKIEPLYPFGYGLSYTKFEYKDLKVQEPGKNNQDHFKITFDLKNTGKLSGAEVAQLYISAIDPKVVRAPKELKAFRRISLKAGETGKVEITINKDDFAYFSTEKNEWTIDPGKYEILVGSSSRDIKLKKTLDIK